MRERLLADGAERTYLAVLDKGDEPVAALRDLAVRDRLGAARITAIGGFARARLGYFDRERTEYLPIEVDEQAEVLSLLGDIALADDEPQVHAHVVVGLRDGTTRGGHLLSAEVWPTLEVLLTESPGYLRKRHDPATGLALIDPRTP